MQSSLKFQTLRVWQKGLELQTKCNQPNRAMAERLIATMRMLFDAVSLEIPLPRLIKAKA